MKIRFHYWVTLILFSAIPLGSLAGEEESHLLAQCEQFDFVALSTEGEELAPGSTDIGLWMVIRPARGDLHVIVFHFFKKGGGVYRATRVINFSGEVPSVERRIPLRSSEGMELARQYATTPIEMLSRKQGS